MRAAFSGVRLRSAAESTRPWQHVLDVLAGYLEIGARLIHGDETAAEAWNLGPISMTGVRVQDLIDAVKTQVPQLRVDVCPDDSGRPESALLQLDSSKAMQRLDGSRAGKPT
jgi:CDP-glucose 4,6-dehydratase